MMPMIDRLNGGTAVAPKCIICRATPEHPERCFGRCVDEPGQSPWIERVSSEAKRVRQQQIIDSLDDLPPVEPRQFRGPLIAQGHLSIGTIDAKKITANDWHRHTVDITDPAPKYVQDELLVFEKGWRRAKYASLLLLGFVLGLGFGYWVLPQWVHHG